MPIKLILSETTLFEFDRVGERKNLL